ncbi:MAG: CSLREA domain-containing protein [Anaerolineales bacterium]|nr:CSLREA domain-containing protein [Anaerolineales bacterium]
MNTTNKRAMASCFLFFCSLLLGSCVPPSTLTVNSDNDADDGSCNSAHCSLREAINKANTLSGTITIAFNVGGGGVQTIRPSSFLPDIFTSIVIDGTTQPGYAGAPLIELDGSLAGVADGLQLRGDNSTVKGLVINRYARDGIRIRAQNVSIQGNFIGTDVTGTVGLGNGANGIDVCCEFAAPPRAVIGGLTPRERNIISANASSGIVLDQHYPGFTHEGRSVIRGNYIGTDVTGRYALGNQWNGILVDGSSDNMIGGVMPGSGNVISANHLGGVMIDGDSVEGNIVSGNRIGTDAAGSAALGNQADGVSLLEAKDVLIGGSESGAGNVVSANHLVGVRIDGSSADVRVLGNYIGTDAAGKAALKNVKAGIVVNGVGHIIGSPDARDRNLISGNGGPGIAVLSTATGIVIKNNYIGTDVSGMSPLGNDMGIEVGMGAGATSVQIGGAGPALALHQGNLISGNREEGVLLFNGAKVWGNLIGTDATGTGPLGNGGNGILVKGSGNQIGGPGSGNTIAFNGRHGVAVISESGSAVENAIQVNQIHDNEGLGIAIADDVVLPNDTLDADTGDNEKQNYPVLISAVTDMGAGTTTFEAELDSKPNTTYSVEFFSNAACDPSGHGEGQSMFNKVMVTTDDQGHAEFSEITFSTNFLFGNNFTLTATDPDGNTSGFSNCVAMTEAAAAGPTVTQTPGRMTFSPFADPTEIYWGRCTPDAVRISVTVENPPEDIGYVLLFARLMDPATGDKTDWSEGLSMISGGKNAFYYDLSIYDLADYSNFKDGVLQYQFVVYNKNQGVLGRSDVYGDVAVRACSRKPGSTG